MPRLFYLGQLAAMPMEFPLCCKIATKLACELPMNEMSEDMSPFKISIAA